MAKTFWEKRTVTTAHFDALGKLIGKTVTTEETEREEEDEVDLEDDCCLCDQCDCDGYCDEDPDECLCDACELVDDCDTKCETGIISTETMDACDACGCKAGPCTGCEVDALRKATDVHQAIDELNRKHLQSATNEEDEIPRMIVISGKGLDSLKSVLETIGVNK